MVLEQLHPAAAAAARSRSCARSRCYLKRLGQRVTIVTPLRAVRPPDSRPSAARASRSGASSIRSCAASARPHDWLRFAAFLLPARPPLRRVARAHRRTTSARSPARSARSLGKPVVREDLGLVGASSAALLAKGRGISGAIARALAQAGDGRAGDQHAHRGRAREARLSGRAHLRAAERRRHDALRARARAESSDVPLVAVFVGRLVPREGARHAARRLGARRSPAATTCACASSATARSTRSCAQQAKRSASRARSSSSATATTSRTCSRAADVGVLPSRIEGLSNTLLEFMACGAADDREPRQRQRGLRRHRAQRLAVRPGDRRRARGCLREAAAVAGERLRELGRAARAQSRARGDARGRRRPAARALSRHATGRSRRGPRDRRTLSHVRHRRHRRRAGAGGSPLEAVGRAMNDGDHAIAAPTTKASSATTQAVIGMRRLSIIDLAGGHQPVHNEDGTVQCRLQRRDLQLPRAARRARGGAATASTRTRTPRSSSTATRSGARAASRASTACSAIALWDTAHAHAAARARSLRREAALLLRRAASGSSSPAS